MNVNPTRSIEITVGRERLAAVLELPSTAPDGAQRPCPVAICCHGLTGTRIGTCYRFVRLARRLTAAGIGCLRFDFRGCGESDGEFVEVTARRLVQDLKAAVAVVEESSACDASRVGIVASSFGAFTTALAAHDLAGLRCLVFWAPVADPRAIIDRDMTEEAWRFLRTHGWIDHRGVRMGRAFVEEIPDVDAAAELARSPRPLLIFHGRGDAHIPISHAEAYRDAMLAAGGEATLEALPLEDHAMRTVEANEQLIERSATWFQRFLHD